jgi:5-methylcytosine-specific restriction endonuclease McrA
MQSEKMSGEKNFFYGKQHTEEIRQIMSTNIKAAWSKNYDRLSEIRKRCAVSGEKHHNWKGGAVSGGKKHRLRMKVLAVYGDKCMIPGCDFSHMVHVHHIVPRAEQGADVVENCILLCPNHHSMADAELFEREYLLSLVAKVRSDFSPLGDSGL